MSQRAELEELFRRLSDEELIARGSSGGLTDLAQDVANAEARSRGVDFKPVIVETNDQETQPGVYHGDMQIVARQLTPTEAHMLVSTLQAVHASAAAFGP